MRIEFPAEPTPAQQAAMDEAAAGPRGRVPAPMRAWIASPGLARCASQLGEVIRFRASLAGHLRELAILLVARRWTSHYEWAVHKSEALKAGLDPAVINAIAARDEPRMTDESANVVYRFATAVIAHGRVSDDLYATAISALGETAVVELVATIGYYGLVSLTNNVFEIDSVPEHERELL